MKPNKLVILIDSLGIWVDGAFHGNSKKDCNYFCRKAGKVADFIWAFANKIDKSGPK